MPVSKNKPLRFGLYGEEEFLLPDFLHCETMEYRSEKHNWVISPHLHANLFQVFLIERGNVHYTFDERQHVTGPAIVTIPENTLHGLEVGKNIKGMVLTLSSSYIESVFHSSPHVLAVLNKICILNKLGNNKNFSFIKQLVNGLHDEMQEDLPERGMALQGFLSLLLGKIFRIALERSEKPFAANNRNARYFSAFLRSVKQSYTPMKSINEYARELNITPVHLNRVCQATVGKSALQVVHEFLFLEAEKYLRHTEYSISEIAYRLNFEDPAYFSRFFGKYAGVSPKLFRQKAD
jgi:AraC family transcriptional regulator, transcriptional activator of pobA